jgi:hypothetical protein
MKRGQYPEKRGFIQTRTGMVITVAAVLAVTTKIFIIRRIYQ